jgi:hypothetical protein
MSVYRNYIYTLWWILYGYMFRLSMSHIQAICTYYFDQTVIIQLVTINDSTAVWDPVASW